jgi:hypothetical protein
MSAVARMSGPPGGLQSRRPSATANRAILALFGLFWLANAAFQFSAWVWSPVWHGAAGLSAVLAKAVNSSPAWLLPAVQGIASGIEGLGALGIASVMVAIALLLGLSLLLRVGLRTACCFGVLYSLFCWIALAALGTPYGKGQTDPGVFPAYMIAFLFALAVAPLAEHRRAGAEPAWAGPYGAVWKAAQGLFGLLWLFDASLKWRPWFLTHFLGQLTPALQGQPHWIAVYIAFVIGAVKTIGPQVVAVSVALIETGIAIALLTGLLLPPVAALGFLYSLAVWSTAEGWGGPYGTMGTAIRGDVLGNALLYAVIFLFVMAGLRMRERP